MSLTEIAAEMRQKPADSQAILDELVAKRLMRKVEVSGEIWYKAHFARKADKKLSTGVWSALDTLLDESKE